jgi:hypothetical protein
MTTPFHSMLSHAQRSGNSPVLRCHPVCCAVAQVIADEYVDMEFGTGALKITPGGWVGGSAGLKRSAGGQLFISMHPQQPCMW